MSVPSRVQQCLFFFCTLAINKSHLFQQFIFLGVMSNCVLWCWLDRWGVWATPGEAVRERVPGCRLSSSYLPTDQSPSKGLGEALMGQRLLKPWWLLTVISSWVHSLQGLPAVRSGAWFCPLKHTNCAHKSCSIVSLCSGSVFMHMWRREVRKQA